MREVNQEQLMQDISERIQRIRSYTPKVGVFGSSGVGKSSLCNALFGKDVAEISDVEACTRKPQEILISNDDGNGGIILVDVPGIGEDPAHQEEYIELYKSLAPELDLVLWTIKADDRSYASGLDAYNAVFERDDAPAVIFVITQVDKINDTDDWNREDYKPGGSQEGNLAKKINDVSSRFDVSTNNIISVAVQVKNEQLTGKSYNLKRLVDLVVKTLPNEKKYSFTREAKDENVSTEARKSAEVGIWNSIKEFAGEAWDVIKDAAVAQIAATAPKFISEIMKRIKL